MDRPAIEVEKLSKRYRLGGGKGEDLREAVGAGLKKILGLVGAANRVGNGADGSENAGKAAGGSGVGEASGGSEFWAIKDISLKVARGEVLGVMGRNGAGKSTLLKILSRITLPTAGRAIVRGRVGSLLEVGTGFHPDLSGRENIYLNGAILGMTRKEMREKFNAIVEFAEIEKFLDTPVKRYSSGMYVRLAFAVAAHLDLEVMIVDEVLAVGDAEFQKRCLGKMRQVAGSGRTVLFVSHQMEALRKLCHRGVVLERGSVAFEGTAEEAVRRYAMNDQVVKSVCELEKPREPDCPLIGHELRIEDLDGRLLNPVPAGSFWRMRLKFEVKKKCDQVVVGVGLRADMTYPLWTLYSRPTNLEPGFYEAVFTNDQIRLATGSYSVLVGLAIHERAVHYVDPACRLEVAAFSEDNDLFRVRGCGALVNRVDVNIRKLGNILEAA